MFTAVENEYLVPFDGSFRRAEFPTSPPSGAPDKDTCKDIIESCVDALDDLQQMLYAHDRYSVLLVFQAMDAAGKDSTIRSVLRGVDPAGFQVFSFKKPSDRELDHDFLWRTAQRLPERGRIGVFNRSYYEEVLIVKVHPEYLNYQKLPRLPVDMNSFWQDRYQSIIDHERHLALNGTLVIKFWLNVSREEQRQRFLRRLDRPEKNWKFSAGDVRERQFWDSYMDAYESALAATSRPWAPWYAIPADDKPFMRATVARTIVDNMKNLGIHYPTVDAKEKARFDEMRQLLESQG